MPVILTAPLVALQFKGEESGRRTTIHVIDPGAGVEIGYADARLLPEQQIPDCTLCAYTSRVCLPAGTGCASVVLLSPGEEIEYCIVSRNGRLRLCFLAPEAVAAIREYMDAYSLAPHDDTIIARGFERGSGAEAWLAEVEGIPVVVAAVMEDGNVRKKLMEETLERFRSLAAVFAKSRILTLPRL